MSIFDSVSKPADKPPIITICGDAGTGKTSLAASFPKPIFIRAEDGLQSIPMEQRPDAFPVLRKGEDVWPQLMGLLQEEHEYQTLVIDSVSRLEALFVADVLDLDPRAKGINQALGGYGNGAAAVAAEHMRVRKAAGLLRDRKGMNVVFISHADLETMRPPDTDDYTRYSLRLMGKSLPPYVDDVDLVGFVRLVSALRGEDGERKRVVSHGERELVCYATAASVSKNRYGITEPLEVKQGLNPLAAALHMDETAIAAKPPKPPKAAKPNNPAAEPAILETDESE